MSNLVHVANLAVCPGIEFRPDRNTLDSMEAADYLWTLFGDFGYQHCIYGCIGCLDRMNETDKKYLPRKPAGDYRTAFNALHDAMGQLPENFYVHLLDIAHGDCPGCAVLTALKQFSKIAHYSENAPVGWDALPCYFEEDMDDWGTRFSGTIHHITALLNLNLNKLPPRMPPAERRDAKAKIAPGKSIVEFVRNFLDGRVQLSATLTDDDLWTLLKWRPTEDDIEFSGTPSRQWKAWAKRELTSSKESGDPLFLSRVLRVALNCYKYATRSYIEGYYENDGLEHRQLSTMYKECEYFCNVVNTYRTNNGYGYLPFNTACEEATGSLLAEKRGYDPTERFYYKLTFIGEKECQKYGGTPPPFFQHEIENETESGLQYMPPPITVTTTDVIDNDATADSNAQAAAKSDANATGIGTGGNAAVTFEREAVKPVAKIESGAVKVEANPTINMPSLDVVGVVSQFKEGMMEAFREGGKHVVQEPKENTASDAKKGNRGRPSDTDKEYDARHAAGWEQYRAAKKTKAEYAEDNSMTVSELDAILGRQRKR